MDRSPSGFRSRGWVAAIGLLLVASMGWSGQVAAMPSSPTAAPAAPVAPAPPAKPVKDGERNIDLDAGWKFILVNPADTTDPSGTYGTATNPKAQAPDFDDSSWRNVTLPHDWSIELLPQASGVSNATGFMQGGLGWYRKTFTLPPSMAGKRLSVEFDGVYMDSYVYLNGTVLGNHPFGYTGFAFDITNVAYTDGVTPNVLAVVVQNKLPSSRWYSGSGITRDVRLVVTPEVHVARLGTFVTTPDLATTYPAGYANVNVATTIENDSGAPATVDVTSKVKDAKGHVVAETKSKDVSVDTSGATDSSTIKVKKPHLWSTTDPYLYTVETSIKGGKNAEDTVTTTIGIRWVVIDPALGVFVNGQHVKLQGVDLHNDEGALGSINNYDALYRQMSILKSMGVNSFRTSHNPPSQEWTLVCDQLGILMMTEAFDSWQSGKSSQDYGRFFAQPTVAGRAALAADSAAGDTNIKVTNVTNFVAGQTITIDTGASLERVLIASVGTLGETGTGLTLATPLTLAHAVEAAVVTVIGSTSLSGASTTLSAGNGNLAATAAAGDTNIKVTSVTNFAVGQTVTIDTGANLESAVIATVGTSGAAGTGLTLAAPLALPHVVNVAVLAVTPAGATVIKVQSVANLAVGQSISIDYDANMEAATIAAVGTAGLTGTGVTLTSGLTMAHGGNMPVLALTPVGATNIKVASVTNFIPGQVITIDSGAGAENATIATVGTAGLGGTTTLAAASAAGATNVKVASVSNMAAGSTINIDTGANLETRTIVTVGTSGSGGTGVTLDSALTLAHASGAAVVTVPTGITLTSPLTLAHATGVFVATAAGPLWSDYDISEMVLESRNSPATIMWSIGNEIPGFATVTNLPVADRLISDIKALDPTRYVVAGSDQYRNLPAAGSGNERILLRLDGLGLNYNPALVVDGLHTKYPTKFFFESESSSEESTRGYYLDPLLLNTGEDQTPGQRNASSYDNNLASWTMSNEYGLKKDRDRQYFAGQYIWSGFDYIGEPTPYNVFPVKASFFGAIDTAGFPKDSYYLFKSQWTSDPMVHIVPMDWTNHKPGEIVQVWAYANVDTVELFLNGVSLGTRTFDHKTSTEGISYLETTECTNDDKNYTPANFPGGTCPGSYQSPNGSAGKLHLTWEVPFEPGQLVAVATKDGQQVARDEVDTAGPAYALKLTPDKLALDADGKSLSYITVQVVDANGVEVPDADNQIDFAVTGAGRFLGGDNGREESAEGYQQPSHAAFNGKALAIIASDTSDGSITVTASADGLLPATTTLFSVAKAKDHDIVGIQPVYVRSRLGSPISLPDFVVAARGDGTVDTLDVKWKKVPKQATTASGTYSIDGDAKGAGKTKAEAIVTVYDGGAIESFSTVVPVGTPPGLPATVKVVWDDGVDQVLPVAWDAVDPSAYAAPGMFIVNGTVAGVTARAIASVRVTDSALANQNIALASGPLHATAGASYSGASSTLPARLIDGIANTGGWSNRFSKSATNILPAVTNSHASDAVTLSWPNPQRIGNASVFFAFGGGSQPASSSQLPASIVVSYWNGMAWVPVSNQVVTLAAVTFTASTITFDPMSPTTGNITIAELQVFSDQVTYNTTAALSDLQVGGSTVAGFDPGTLEYTVAAAGKAVPPISATAADNGRLLIVPPITVPGTATITVSSEDGAAHTTYLVHLTH